MLVVARTLASQLRQTRSLFLQPSYSFTFLKLFEAPKTREQLSPIFKLPARHPGHSLHKTKPRHESTKLAPHTRVMPHKLHNHNSLVKRIKIVGPRHARQFKFLHVGKRHLNRNKSRSNLLRKRKARYISRADTERVRKMVPSFKRRAFKFFH